MVDGYTYGWMDSCMHGMRLNTHVRILIGNDVDNRNNTQTAGTKDWSDVKKGDVVM